LEQIKERAIMDLDKQDKRSRDILSESPVRLRDQISPSGRRTSSREKVAPGQIFESESVTDRDLTSGELVGSARSNIAAGLYPMAGSNDSIPLQKQALKKRVKKLRQRLASRKSEFLERSPGVDGYGMGSASLAGDSICVFHLQRFLFECNRSLYNWHDISAKFKWRHA
jgi:hypothetical protein